MDNLQVTLYAPNIFDNFVLNYESSFTTDQMDSLISDYSSLSWDNFPEALIICNYENDLNSSSSPLGVITDYAIQRKEYNDNFWQTVFEAPVGSIPIVNNNYVLEDYNIKNNVTYVYRLCAKTIDKDCDPIMYMDNINNVPMPILTNWEYFTLTPLQITLDSYNSDYKVATPIVVNGKPQVWSFIANCEESGFTKNQDKTYFNSFVKYPKVSVGQQGYFTANFSALLGTIDENCYYSEPSYLLEQWNEFIDNNYICLYKNLKGDARIVSINSEPTNTYANIYNTYYPQNPEADDYITNRPTTIAFSMTEVDDASKYRIVS